MIGYFCLIYIGVHTSAPWWYFVLAGLGASMKLVSAAVNTMLEDET